jgi:hypothetical protein
MQNESIPDQKLVDQVLCEIFQKLVVSDDFNVIVDNACLKVFGTSTPSTRAYVRQAYYDKVGL